MQKEIAKIRSRKVALDKRKTDLDAQRANFEPNVKIIEPTVVDSSTAGLWFRIP